MGRQLRTILSARYSSGQVYLYETTEAGDAESLVQIINTRDNIICAVGGDGTIHEIVNGLMRNILIDVEKDVRICPVPCGSGNAIAAESNIRSIRDVVDLCETPTAREIDIIEVDSGVRLRYSVLNIMYGFIADVDIYSEWLRKWCGSLRFIIYALWMLMTYVTLSSTIFINDVPTNITTLVYSNFAHLTQSDIIDNDAKPDDKKLNMVYCPGSMSRCEIASILARGLHTESPNLRRQTVSKPFVLSGCTKGLNIDGELYPNMTKATCRFSQKRLKFLAQ